MLSRLSVAAAAQTLIFVLGAHGQAPPLYTLHPGGQTSSASNNAPASAAFDIRKLMSAEQFQNAGLGKLSPSEITSLNQWLDSFSTRVWTSAQKHTITTPDHAVATPPRLTTPTVIESEIDGDFEGWSGETIFKLNNGQIWQQTEYDYEYEYAYNPEVTIYKASECYKMKVEDMSDTICVRRLK
jgi:hypothetical protein